MVLRVGFLQRGTESIGKIVVYHYLRFVSLYLYSNSSYSVPLYINLTLNTITVFVLDFVS